MYFSERRRRTPMMHFILLITCLILCGVIAAQQSIITKQRSLIGLLSGDSSQLAVLKLQQAQAAK